MIWSHRAPAPHLVLMLVVGCAVAGAPSVPARSSRSGISQPLKSHISSLFWLVRAGVVLSLSGDTLFYSLSVNKVKHTVFKDQPSEAKLWVFSLSRGCLKFGMEGFSPETIHSISPQTQEHKIPSL